jgi:hypothetical protein
VLRDMGLGVDPDKVAAAAQAVYASTAGATGVQP